MRLTQRQRFWLGAATFWPLAWIVLFVAAVLAMVALGLAAEGRPVWLPLFFVVFPLHFITIAGIVVLEVFYVVYIALAGWLTDAERVVWIVLLLFFSLFAMPLVWLLVVRDAPTT